MSPSPKNDGAGAPLKSSYGGPFLTHSAIQKKAAGATRQAIAIVHRPGFCDSPGLNS
jgi:hypothetical protein